DDNLLPIISTEVQGKVLTITGRKGFSSTNEVLLNITTHGLSRLLMTASGNVSLNKMHESMLEITLRGAVNLQANGQVGTLKVRLEGTGDMDLDRLQSDVADVVLSGAGNARIFATGTFSGLLQGSGNIWVRGNPQMLRSNVYGAGRILPVR
ncbi:hypothetical protein TI03_03590, partial [Achromatium sp. WMS1]